jgi:hypothetical protein
MRCGHPRQEQHKAINTVIDSVHATRKIQQHVRQLRANEGKCITVRRPKMRSSHQARQGWRPQSLSSHHTSRSTTTEPRSAASSGGATPPGSDAPCRFTLRSSSRWPVSSSAPGPSW